MEDKKINFLYFFSIKINLFLNFLLITISGSNAHLMDAIRLLPSIATNLLFFVISEIAFCSKKP